MSSPEIPCRSEEAYAVNSSSCGYEIIHLKNRDTMDAKGESHLPTTALAFRPTRRAPLGRRGSWRKRYVVIAVFLLMWLASHYISKSVILSRARLYEDLQKMMVRRPATVAGSDSTLSTGVTDYSLRMSNITKVSMAYGNITDVYQRALDRQMLHSEIQGYDTLILETKILGRLYTKPAYILFLLLNELQKAEQDQIQWIYWFDLDMVLMNTHIPLEIFLPPTDLNLDDVNAVVTDDHNGLNTGAFFIRVNYWSAQVFADIVAMPSLQPEVTLKYSEQSALELRLRDPRNKGKAVWVPQYWFNGYRGSRDDRGELRELTPEATRKGGLQIHFAGKPVNKERMPQYLDIAESGDPRWELPLERTGLIEETRIFWEHYAEKLKGPVKVEKTATEVTTEARPAGSVTKDEVLEHVN